MQVVQLFSLYDIAKNAFQRVKLLQQGRILSITTEFLVCDKNYVVIDWSATKPYSALFGYIVKT